MRQLKTVIGILLVALTLAACGTKYQFTFEVGESDQRLCPPDDLNVLLTVFSDVVYEMNKKGDVYTYTIFENKPFDFYFAFCETPVWDMRAIEDRYTPKPDYYVNDGQGQYNALIIPVKDDDPRSLTFKFYPGQREMNLFCRSASPSMSVWINETTEFVEYPLKSDDAAGAYSATVDVIGNVVEFYFSICGTTLSHLENYQGKFEPAVNYFSDDGKGGFNALYIDE